MVSGIKLALSLFEESPTKLAAAIGNGVLRQHVEHWVKAGRVPAAKCPDVSAVTGIPCDQLNDTVNWGLVRTTQQEANHA